MKLRKIMSMLIGTIAITPFSNIIVVSNNDWLTTNNVDQNHTNIINDKNQETVTKIFDARLIGAQKGTFTLEFKKDNTNECTFTANEGFYANFCRFNFNDGKFESDGKTYTITKIADNAFNDEKATFSDILLTIPSTIKEIGKSAFRNKNLISLEFEEGIERINAFAFRNIQFGEFNTLVFPNSIKYIACNAFYDNRIEQWDLTKLDHVIGTDENKEKGVNIGIGDNFRFWRKWTLSTIPVYWDNIKIIIKDEKIKNQYLEADNYKDLFKHGKIVVEGQEKIRVSLPGYFLNELNQSECWKFTIEYLNKDNCLFNRVYTAYPKITNEFSFNKGSFKYASFNYTIVGINNHAFNCQYGPFSNNAYFSNCFLTIPSTIKQIGKYAFNNNSRAVGSKEIRGIKLQEGLEDIGESAFRKCNDLIDRTMKLPSTLKHMGNDAFSRTGIQMFDLTALDHVIEVDCDVDSFNGCLPSSTEIIYVKSQVIKNKYLADKHWKNIAKKKMVVKQ